MKKYIKARMPIIILFLLSVISTFYMLLTMNLHAEKEIIPNVLSSFIAIHFGVWHEMAVLIFKDFQNSSFFLFNLSMLSLIYSIGCLFKKRVLSIFIGVISFCISFVFLNQFTHEYATTMFSVNSFAFSLVIIFGVTSYIKKESLFNSLYFLAFLSSIFNLFTCYILSSVEKYIGVFIFPFAGFLGNVNLFDLFIFIAFIALLVETLFMVFYNYKKSALYFLLVFNLFIFSSCQKKNDVHIITSYSENTEGVVYNDDKEAFFGDLHLHTANSFDAFGFGNSMVYPDDAYRFAKGEEIILSSGESLKREIPLDFLAVTDHAEYLGVFPKISNSFIEEILSDKSLVDIVMGIVGDEIFSKAAASFVKGVPIKKLMRKDLISYTWEDLKKTAIHHHNPGDFTTFIGYEWSSSFPVKTEYNISTNFHRNVIFSNGSLPSIPFSSIDSHYEEDLWYWMESQRKKGSSLLAIPHNGNKSGGLMYNGKSTKGFEITKKMAQQRMRNEPIHEVIQIKAQSMAHPSLSPNDEFAEFEINNEPFYTDTLDIIDNAKKIPVRGNYVREALKEGLLIDAEKGANPYQFGFIGSTDTHMGLSFTSEEKYVGEHFRYKDSLKFRIEDRTEKTYNPGGLAGIWSKANTRNDLYQAMEIKEVFATSGTRIKVRFFVNKSSATHFFNTEKWSSLYDDNAVPMGGIFDQGGSESPDFMVWAIKDPSGANLDRVQIVKGWIDEDGVSKEKVFNVVWSNNPERIINKETGLIPAIPNTVNNKNATYSNIYGSDKLKAIWKDPEFKENQKSFYYVRVLEIPTPRWSTYSAKKSRINVSKELPSFIQERAWSSPIWFN